MRLYRYRNIDNAFKELEKGTFYFANYKELNDPIEGYIRLYWQGDKYAWEGLFKNYICSLYYSIQYYLVCDEKYYLDSKQYFENIGLIVDLNKFNNIPLGKLLQNLYKQFLNNEFIQKVINFCSDNKKIYSKQIKLIFILIHFIALTICLEGIKESINIELLPLNILEEMHKKSVPLITPEQLNIIYADNKHLIDIFNAIYKNEKERHLLTSLLSNCSDLNEKRRYIHCYSIFVEFPNIYMDQLKDIIYPDGHIVCFSINPTSSSMWGNYADNHKGICFIYETKNVDNKEVIPVEYSTVEYPKVGYSKVEYSKIEIKPIKYGDSLIERNFFLSLGLLTPPQIDTWLSGINPNLISGLLNDYFSMRDDENKWRNKYWSDFEEIFLRKLTDWKEESEYRMIMSDSLHELEDKTKRVKQYDKECLKGIIFGIRINIEDKIKLIEKILNLGKNIKEFEFYQASYDEELNKIILIRLYY